MLLLLNQLPVSNFEEVFVAAKKDADEKSLPFRYLQVISEHFSFPSKYLFDCQIDAWWYYQDTAK